MSFFKRLFRKREHLPVLPAPLFAPAPKAKPEVNGAPTQCPGNPSKGTFMRLTVDGPAGYRQEEIDLLESLAAVLRMHELDIVVKEGKLADRQSGLEFLPGIVSFEPHDDLSMSMCTVVEISHPKLFPHPVFEYQHSRGATGEESVRWGFDQWAQLDLPVLLDAIRTEPLDCMTLKMTMEDGQCLRILLGPVQYHGPETPPHSGDDGDEDEAHTPFCSCCMFTSGIEVFKPLIEEGGFGAIRLYAARDQEGEAIADCRLNGEDFEPGKQALIKYASGWPDIHLFEFRKQYLIFQDWVD